jgi:hypothetical protein
MVRFIAAILIITHIHHSFVMIAGDLMKVSVVSAAIEAGIPLFENAGTADQGTGAEAPEAPEAEDADFCSRNALTIDCGTYDATESITYMECPYSDIVPVHTEILTPPPQVL